MRFFLLLILWVLIGPLVGQNCSDARIGDIGYRIGYEAETRKAEKYLVPCSRMETLSILFPENFYHPGPDAGTDPGIFVFVIPEIPESGISVEDFLESLYRDPAGDLVYFRRSEGITEMDKLMSVRDRIGSFFFLPVLVSNKNAVSPELFFESSCVPFFPDQALQILDNPKNHFEFTRFDGVRFAGWPEDTSILAFFDFDFRDAGTDEPISFTQVDPRTLKLRFPREKGVMNMYVNWKDYSCDDVEFGNNWAFPEPRIAIDSAEGFRNIEKCVPVRVDDFQSVTGFELSFRWHADSLDYSGISNIHPALAPLLREMKTEEEGDFVQLKIAMLPGRDTIDLPDSTVIFEWCGKPLTAAGTVVTVYAGPEEGPDEPGFEVYGFPVEHSAAEGRIRVLEDRTLDYALEQLCSTRKGENRLLLTLHGADAFPYAVFFRQDSLVFHEDEWRDSSLLIPHLPAGRYEFVVRDSFGFEKREEIEVSDFVAPGFKVNADEERSRDPDCLNPSGGVIAVSVSSAGEYSFDLPGYPDREFQGDSVTGLEAGRYVIRAEDENGCIDTVSYHLFLPAEIQVGWDTAELVFCPGTEEVVFVLENVSGEPDSSLEYQISGSPVAEPGEEVILDTPGYHKISLWNGDGCSLDTFIMVLEAPDEIAVFDSAVIEVHEGEEVRIPAGEEWADGAVRWTYEEETVGEDPALVFAPVHSGVLHFQAQLYGRCDYRDSVQVQVISISDRLPEEGFPNAFSPNGDGENDRFRLFPTAEIREIVTVQVYDRYGNFVYEEKYGENTAHTGWDGMIDGQEASPGVYAVVVEYIRRNGRPGQAVFDLMLIR